MSSRGLSGLLRCRAGATDQDRTERHATPRRLQSVTPVLLAGLLLIDVDPVARAQAQDAPTEATVILQITKTEGAVTAGDWLEFDAVLRNQGATATPPLTAHLSIAPLTQGKHVDPEDWAPQRTQYLHPVPPGESVQLPWRLHALFEGTFASFVTVVSEEGSFRPVVSESLRLRVAPDKILPWKDVIPVVVVVPIVPLVLLVFGIASARRQRRLAPVPPGAQVTQQ